MTSNPCSLQCTHLRHPSLPVSAYSASEPADDNNVIDAAVRYRPQRLSTPQTP